MNPLKSQFAIEALLAFIFAVCVLLALLLLTGCGPRDELADEGKTAIHGDSITFANGSAAPQRLMVERVEAPVEHELALPARLTWDEERTVRVFPPFAGRVVRIVARPGDRVAVGAPLAELISPDFGQAQADARKAQADLEVSTRSLERERELAAHGVASAKDLEQAQGEARKAQAEADRALGRVNAYGHGVAGDNRFVLRSPTAGVVVERNLNPGQELRPDQPGSPLFVITDPTHLWIAIDAGEGDAAGMKPGTALTVMSTQFPDVAFPGELVQISDFIDPTTRTLKLRGAVPNKERQLKGEMFVTARIRVPKGQLPTVASRAVFLSGASNYVFVRTAAYTFTRHAVRVGRESDGRRPVLAGLREGDEVVVGGNLFLDQLLASAPPQPAPDTTEKTATAR
ncbi:MAG TPA: efflux RND transporter periplasmic adaptor subunit [Usitatibacter sp.]|jgi:cobalt-zinc-cadmium efflux system membrane fusion protein|nr:efflux RND transporter periplasmic adaptor subunit [Usitatibacter sp.]